MAYEMTIKERLRKFVHFRDLKDYEFETMIKVARGFLSSDSEPNGKAIVSILTAFPDINPDWLILGAGEMTRAEKTPSTPSTPEAASEPVDGYGWSPNPQGAAKLLQERIYFLEKLVEEKERTIQILMNNK